MRTHAILREEFQHYSCRPKSSFCRARRVLRVHITYARPTRPPSIATVLRQCFLAIADASSLHATIYEELRHCAVFDFFISFWQEVLDHASPPDHAHAPIGSLYALRRRDQRLTRALISAIHMMLEILRPCSCDKIGSFSIRHAMQYQGADSAPPIGQPPRTRMPCTAPSWPPGKRHRERRQKHDMSTIDFEFRRV